MKSGKTLQELAAEVQAQQAIKQDYIADTRDMRMLPDAKRLDVQSSKQVSFDITDHTHRQLQARLNINANYYNRLREDHPDLLAHNVNELFQREPERRMVRTLGGTARAFVSDRYARLDHNDMLETILPEFKSLPAEFRFESMELTENRMYLKVVFPSIERTVSKVGDVVQAGAVLSNSEIGLGAWGLSFLVWTLRCLNGMIGESLVKRHHIGKRLESADGVIYAEDTLAADDKALQLRTRDALRSIISGSVMDEYVAKLDAAAESDPVDHPIKAVQVLANQVQLTDGERDSVLEHLLKGGDLSKYGVANAVTSAAQEVESYDRSTEMEHMGHKIITLPTSDWQEMLKAA